MTPFILQYAPVESHNVPTYYLRERTRRFVANRRNGHNETEPTTEVRVKRTVGASERVLSGPPIVAMIID